MLGFYLCFNSVWRIYWLILSRIGNIDNVDIRVLKRFHVTKVINYFSERKWRRQWQYSCALKVSVEKKNLENDVAKQVLSRFHETRLI